MCCNFDDIEKEVIEKEVTYNLTDSDDEFIVKNEDEVEYGE